MTGFSLIDSPEMKRPPGITTGLRVVASPVETFRRQAPAPRPMQILLGIVLLTIAVAVVTGPIVHHLLRVTPAIAASQAVATQFVLIQGLIITPVGTIAFLLLVASILWSSTLMIGQDLALKQATTIAFTAGMAGVLKRSFVGIVLYLRWVWNPNQLDADVSTGADALLSPQFNASFTGTVVQHIGIFDVWFAALLILGLRFCGGLHPKHAALSGILTAGLITSARVFITMITGS